MGNLFRLDGRVAIVTGAGRGLGAAMAKGLAEYGASVAVADINFKSAQETAETICQSGGQAFPIAVNVTDAVSVDEMVQNCLGKYGTVDILINSAGIVLRSPITETSEEDWDAVIAVNLKGTFLCTRAVGRVLAEKEYGRVINIASILGSVAQPGRGSYPASKGAVIQFTKMVALEWAQKGITVNTLAPGYFLTEINTALMENKPVFDDLTSRIPMGRWGDPKELVGPVVFLASEAGSYVTGQLLNCEGGYLAL